MEIDLAINELGMVAENIRANWWMIVMGDDALEGDGVKNFVLELRFTVMDPLLAHVVGSVSASLLCKTLQVSAPIIPSTSC
jgi:hypothetical protein